MCPSVRSRVVKGAEVTVVTVGLRSHRIADDVVSATRSPMRLSAVAARGDRRVGPVRAWPGERECCRMSTTAGAVSATHGANRLDAELVLLYHR